MPCTCPAPFHRSASPIETLAVSRLQALAITEDERNQLVPIEPATFELEQHQSGGEDRRENPVNEFDPRSGKKGGMDAFVFKG